MINMLGKTIIQSGAPDRMYHIMHDGITLVTAFFPIGRGEWTGKAQRSDDKYFKYFQHWARIHNDLVVYTTPENAERIRQIRLSFGRTNTQVYIVNDLEDIDKSMYTLMHDVGKHYPKYSLFPDKPEVSNPIYDFVMYTKFWCLAQASTVAIRTISGSTALGTILAQMAKLRFSKFANCHPIQFLIAYDALKHIFKETASNWILIMHNNSMLMYETNMSIFYVADYLMTIKLYFSCVIMKSLTFIVAYQAAGSQCWTNIVMIKKRGCTRTYSQNSSLLVAVVDGIGQNIV